MIIAVASGKGGTGKTSVSVSLALACDSNALLLDCDVEEPNVDIFLQNSSKGQKAVVAQMPILNADKCNGCGNCAKACQFGAIAIVNTKPIFFNELCHSCGACTIACKREAISEKSVEIGSIFEWDFKKVHVAQGKLNVGSALSVPIINELKKLIVDKNKINILDCPPGTACPVIASLKQCDYAILVTEPTPFGLNDLILAIDTAKALNIPFGIVINKSSQNDSLIEDFCAKNNYEVLAKIPESMEVARNYSIGTPPINVSKNIESIFVDLVKNVKDKCNVTCF